jgi:hypothetical protein
MPPRAQAPGAIPVVLHAQLLELLRRPNSYLGIGVIGVAGVAVYALCYLALSRGKPEHALIRQQAGVVLSYVKHRAVPSPSEAPKVE